MGPGDLRALLDVPESAVSPRDPRVLVGTETGDDAGVCLLPGADGSAGENSVVTTADFITPPFDDPDAYGRIAAANSLSDVYAMGGTPICAINLCMFPRELEPAVAKEILGGARDLLAESGVALVGGHTVRGPELFYGLAVTGVVSSQRIWRNVGAQPGDVLFLTKPLGAGLIVTGARRKLIGETERRACAAVMARTNRRAAQALGRFSIHAATDVTGFGLIGHALGMTRHGAVSLHIDAQTLPVYAGAAALADSGLTCGGARANRETYFEAVARSASLSPGQLEILFDPQTSGGLLVAVPAHEAAAVEQALTDAGALGARIGEAVSRQSAAIAIR